MPQPDASAAKSLALSLYSVAHFICANDFLISTSTAASYGGNKLRENNFPTWI